MTTTHVLPQEQVNPQLNLPTALGLVRPRRERTDEDRDWYSEQLAVPHEKLIDKAVFERMAFYGSLNPERTAFPAVKRLAREALCSERSVRYALRRLESSGLVECVSPGCGRSTSRYRIVGSSDCRADLQTVQVRPAPVAPNVLKEGNSVSKSKDPSLTAASVKSIDPDLLEKVAKQIGVDCLPFPSQEQKQEQEQEQKASAPVPEETVFVNENQVKMLFKLQRKLGYRADDGQAGVFDGLEHADRKRILDKLLAEEQLAAAQGKVPAPPKAAPSPRHEFPLPVVRKTVRERPTCSEHRWTPAASDGVQNCYGCDAEKTQD